jgi:hypothetical protein
MTYLRGSNTSAFLAGGSFSVHYNRYDAAAFGLRRSALLFRVPVSLPFAVRQGSIRDAPPSFSRLT